jgi:hypothetical protein
MQPPQCRIQARLSRKSQAGAGSSAVNGMSFRPAWQGERRAAGQVAARAWR